MAMLKMNVFHWHLTEGQGWRIEIKSYPKLTEIGAHVSEGSSKGRYYTQQDIKEIVSYAKERCITVVPEIDIPGHSEAALTAYPEHSCFKEKPSAKMTFSATLFCGGRESTYAFLETIFDEVCALFPSQYIHIGGDEAPKERWKSLLRLPSQNQKRKFTQRTRITSLFLKPNCTLFKNKRQKSNLLGGYYPRRRTRFGRQYCCLLVELETPQNKDFGQKHRKENSGYLWNQLLQLPQFSRNTLVQIHESKDF